MPFKRGSPPLDASAIRPLLAQLEGWKVVAGHHLEKEYEFAGFADALAFVNRVGAVAEEQDHHPDIELGWGRVGLKIWTHTVDGLTENDFVLAAKCDRALAAPKRRRSPRRPRR